MYYRCQLILFQGKLGIAKISYLGRRDQGLRSRSYFTEWKYALLGAGYLFVTAGSQTTKLIYIYRNRSGQPMTPEARVAHKQLKDRVEDLIAKTDWKT